MTKNKANTGGTLLLLFLTLLVDTDDNEWELTASDTTAPSCFFDRVSDALSSMTSYPSSLAIKYAVVVFPTPGGPDKRAALAQNPLSAPEFHGGGLGAAFFRPELFWCQLVILKLKLID